ncbi:MFS transporter [Streptomyces sp. NPDC057499]|uniref:MFS transporter n=1 Tax=Streptomyces sp. NPDC057499 TaxID=3346150 RepID=UPI0036CC982D
MSPHHRLAAFRARDFRRFFIGYATSLLGSSMASIAISFAVLENDGDGTELGVVLAARILPLVLVLLVGGVVTDRLGSRQVMITADVVRCLSQAGIAVALFSGSPGLWTLVALVALWGAAEALFTPALNALVPHIAKGDTLADANALLGVARSFASIAGPVLAGILTAVAGASWVLALDSASYAVSVVALLLLPRAAVRAAPSSSFVADLREGWAEFRSRTWLWATSLQAGLFNLLVWAPFLVLGPLVAQRRLGGAGSWGLVMALYGAGAMAGGAAMLGRHPRRPLLVATVAALGWSLPSAALAADGSLVWICVAALVAGAGSAVCGTLYATVTQQQVPPGALARVSSYDAFGAFALGPLGLAAAGPVSVLVGTSAVLGFGALWQIVTVAVLLALPAVRAVFPRSPAEVPAGSRADTGPEAAARPAGP